MERKFGEVYVYEPSRLTLMVVGPPVSGGADSTSTECVVLDAGTMTDVYTPGYMGLWGLFYDGWEKVEE